MTDRTALREDAGHRRDRVFELSKVERIRAGEKHYGGQHLNGRNQPQIGAQHLAAPSEPRSSRRITGSVSALVPSTTWQASPD